MAEPIVEPVVTPDAGAGNSGVKPDSNGSAAKPDPIVTPVSAADQKAADERNRGILADLQKERKQRQEFERQIASLTGERDTERRRIQALVGANPRSEEETQLDEVRQRFG